MPILNWLTRDEDLRRASRVPYRLLEEVPDLSAGDGSAGNMLIQGDNLEALKALLPFYAGRVKCIYIDPPYNTGAAFEHYDDNLEHTQWLAMMWPRLELLRDLLAEDGSIWVSIDDNEGHYLKVIMDEVFGRRNFVVNVVWQKRIGPDNRIPLGDAHDHIMVYGREREKFRSSTNRIPLTEKQRAQFKNPDNDPRGPWTSSSNFSAQGYRPNQMYEITTPGGAIHRPPAGRCWVTIEPEFLRLKSEGRMWFGSDGNGMPRKKTYLNEHEGRMSWSWWSNDDVGNTQESKKEVIALFGDDLFDTPKPERLIERILHIATNPGDLVLDSFLGSGTTAAVAHKMGRRYIGIEMGEHARTHCAPRLQKVIDGEQGGISKSVGWQGGGGFRFYRLGPPVFDETGHIRQDIRFPVLAAHVWFSETDRPWDGSGDSPLLGIHDGRAHALLYNGILGDRRPGGGNVLTRATLAIIREEIAKVDPAFDGPLTIYGEQSRLTPATLDRERITFKQTPYDVKARA
ncbi:site-specific DNA-methyltransferase [Chelatococcus sp. XZ-Ab1]|uniref:site-specific DNA-methyltransferase n=1 Tax=Chelatococcus sp. XZ-Ab1 TaxID=3034027 RepID=UPI0023E466D1|nr:site-specific DNA-methyltransferase [Chelatococcus sp. XZ-Ab1]